ncbi:MAG: hypothetical protein K2M34_03230 [Alphaproteobacteria bacterium]|nr:hypothetical protein [Alphaproteobacteria bacterium]
MSVIQENRAIMANSSIWVRFVALLKAFGEYTNDYLSGNKHKYLKREKQK